MTCEAVESLVSGRSVEKAGETCTINAECTAFFCTGVVDRVNQVVADSTYTFNPCKDPITLTVFSEVSTQSDPVIDTVLDESATVTLMPSYLGSVRFILEQADDGVRFGVSDAAIAFSSSLTST